MGKGTMATTIADSNEICTIESISNDVLSHQIFSYFNLHSWMNNLVPVCKRWKEVCEQSKNANGQLTINLTSDFEKYLPLVQKYQPTILYFCSSYFFNGDDDLYTVSIFAILFLIRASKRCTTVVFANECLLSTMVQPTDSQKMQQITTLFIVQNVMHCLPFFPRVQRLQIESDKLPERKDIPANVETLAITDKFNTRILWGTVENVYQNPKGYLLLSSLTYLEYAMFTGKTRLFYNKSFSDVENLLLSGETSLQREIELGFHNLHLDYQFGISPQGVYRYISSGASEKIYEVKKQVTKLFYEQLSGCVVKVPPQIALYLTLNFGSTEEAVAVLKSLQLDMDWREIYEHFILAISKKKVANSVLNDRHLLSHVVDLFTQKSEYLCSNCKELEAISWIWEFIDWNLLKLQYSKAGTQTFLKCIYKAIELEKIPQICKPEFLGSLLEYLSDYPNWGVLDDLIKVDSNFTVLLQTAELPYQYYNTCYNRLVKEYNVNPIPWAFYAVKHNSNFLHCLQTVPFDWTISHPESIFILLLKGKYYHQHSIEGFLGLLQLGADPSRVPQNSVTVLAFIAETPPESSHEDNKQLIDILLEFGVNINEPSSMSVDDGAKHTPLSIAMLAKHPKAFLDFLRLRGALTDEELNAN